MKADRDVCRGHGVCTQEAPEVFGLDKLGDLPTLRQIEELMPPGGPDSEEQVAAGSVEPVDPESVSEAEMKPRSRASSMSNW